MLTSQFWNTPNVELYTTMIKIFAYKLLIWFQLSFVTFVLSAKIGFFFLFWVHFISLFIHYTWLLIQGPSLDIHLLSQTEWVFHWLDSIIFRVVLSSCCLGSFVCIPLSSKFHPNTLIQNWTKPRVLSALKQGSSMKFIPKVSLILLTITLQSQKNFRIVSSFDPRNRQSWLSVLPVLYLW